MCDNALALKDWTAAKSQAERGIDSATSGYKLFAYELQNNLILRAAVGTLSTRVLQLSAQLGLNPPEKFNARQDLLRLWRMVPER